MATSRVVSWVFFTQEAAKAAVAALLRAGFPRNVISIDQSPGGFAVRVDAGPRPDLARDTLEQVARAHGQLPRNGGGPSPRPPKPARPAGRVTIRGRDALANGGPPRRRGTVHTLPLTHAAPPEDVLETAFSAGERAEALPPDVVPSDVSFMPGVPKMDVAPPRRAFRAAANGGGAATTDTSAEGLPVDATPTEATTPAEGTPEEASPETTPMPSGVPGAPESTGSLPGSAAAANGNGQRAAGDPPRTAHGRLDCPAVVVAGMPFALTCGLSAEPSAGVSGGPLERPASSVGDYDLTVQLVAAGFSLAPGESARQTLRVTGAAPYPSFTVHLTGESVDAQVAARAVQAIYSVDGQTMGFVVRPVSVVRSADLLGPVRAETQPVGATITVPTGTVAPDLTVRITVHGTGGTLLWSLDTPHQNVDLPDGALTVDIGDQPEVFARQLVDDVNALEGKPGLALKLRGIGRQIADQIPAEFWPVLQAVAEQVRPQAPTMLVLSQEPYVPWELAVLETPLDPGAPPFLAAQVAVGRWMLAPRRPKSPPPQTATIQTMAVVFGVYDQVPGWQRLEQAELEAAAIQQAYGAAAVNADSAAVLQCIEGTPPADLLHFAVHGIYDPTGIQDGLVLVDGETLDPDQVRGADLSRAPFVFLNACQVGSGERVLGDYSGLAAAFLYAGAKAVVAPLWSIRDSVAREIALRFYECIFQGEAPAEVLRRERGAFKVAAGTPPSATYLAYQFFGDPSLRVIRQSTSP